MGVEPERKTRMGLLERDPMEKCNVESRNRPKLGLEIS